MWHFLCLPTPGGSQVWALFLMKMAKFYAGLQNQTDIYSVKLLSANQIPSTKVSAGDTEISVNLSLFWSLGCPNGYLLFFLIKFWKQSCAIL